MSRALSAAYNRAVQFSRRVERGNAYSYCVRRERGRSAAHCRVAQGWAAAHAWFGRQRDLTGRLQQPFECGQVIRSAIRMSASRTDYLGPISIVVLIHATRATSPALLATRPQRSATPPSFRSKVGKPNAEQWSFFTHTSHALVKPLPPTSTVWQFCTNTVSFLIRISIIEHSHQLLKLEIIIIILLKFEYRLLSPTYFRRGRTCATLSFIVISFACYHFSEKTSWRRPTS